MIDSGLILLGILGVLVAIFVQYFIIRLAVRHALTDAQTKARRAPAPAVPDPQPGAQRGDWFFKDSAGGSVGDSDAAGKDAD